MKYLFLVVFFVFITFKCNSQNSSISGLVMDEVSKEPIVGATVIVINAHDENIETYALTDPNGFFSLDFISKDIDKYSLEVTYLGYEKQIISLKDKIEFQIQLKEKEIVLKEVIVKADKIIQKHDTISYLVSSFTTDKDRTIGEVIANMPGIVMADNGKIIYNGKAIDKFYIEGIDLLGSKYNIATNNISHDIIARVDVVENYQPIKALRETGLDTETIMNLKLKDGAKSNWSGNLMAKGGMHPSGGIWENEIFAAIFSAKNQNITTLKSNNSGKNIIKESESLTIDDLLYMYSNSDIAASININPLKSSDIDENVTRFNKTHMLTNTNMWKTSDNAQSKLQIILSEDKNNNNQDLELSYYLIDTTLTHKTSENRTINDKNIEAIFQTTIDKDSYFLSDKLTYASIWRRGNSNICGNYNNTSIADTDIHKVENRLKYIKNLKNDFFQITSMNKYMFIPENLEVFGKLDRLQNIDKNNFFSNTNFRYIHSFKKFALILNTDIFGNVYKMKSDYASEFDSQKNNINVNYIGSSLKPELKYQKNTFEAKLEMPISWYKFQDDITDTEYFFKPSMYLKWRFLPRWSVSINGTIGDLYTGNSLSYNFPIMIDYRTFNSGLVNSEAGIKTVKRFSARLSFSNPSEMLFSNLSISRSTEDKKVSIVSKVNKDVVYQSYVNSESITKYWFANWNISKGIDLINGKIELRSAFQKYTMPIVQNDKKISFDIGNFSSDLSLISSPTDWLDINYRVGYKYNFMKNRSQKSITKNINQNCTLTFYPTEGLYVNLNTEHYFTTFSTEQNKNLLLSNLECVYRYKKFDFNISVSNIFDNKTYNYNTYDTTNSTFFSYNIRRRNILLGLTWYF